MLLTAVFFVSLATLAFEVLLTRVFSIGQWNHLSFMVISIALFGFAGSGTFLSLVQARRQMNDVQPAWAASIDIIVCLYAISAIASFLILNHIPLDYFRLPVEPVQCLYLLAAFLVLALPFFFSGLLISLAYTTMPEKTGLVYFSSMVGSGCGALLPMPLLPVLGEGRLIVAVTLIVLIPIFFSTLTPLKKTGSTVTGRRNRVPVAICCIVIIIWTAFLLTPAGISLIQVKPSPYKALSQVLRFPDSRIVATRSSIRGRLDRVESPYIRFAPGLSLQYTEALPRQQAVYTDGDNQFVLYANTNENTAPFCEFTLSYAGYHLVRSPENILLIQHGGGSSIPCAIATGAKHVTIVENNNDLAETIHQHYALKVVNKNPRDFLSQTADRYDIIHLENWGTSIPGTAALNQSHLLSENAFAQYFSHLTAKGVFIVSRRLLLPPSDSLRLWSTAYDALRDVGIEDPANHIAILRNWDIFTLLISKPMLSSPEIIDFTERLNFDVVFLKDFD